MYNQCGSKRALSLKFIDTLYTCALPTCSYKVIKANYKPYRYIVLKDTIERLTESRTWQVRLT